VVAFWTVTPDAATPPIKTVAPLAKSAPVMVTAVVPVVLPAVGEMADTLSVGVLGPAGESPRQAAAPAQRTAMSARGPRRVRTDTIVPLLCV